jgi:hypothetical protein
MPALGAMRVSERFWGSIRDIRLFPNPSRISGQPHRANPEADTPCFRCQRPSFRVTKSTPAGRARPAPLLAPARFDGLVEKDPFSGQAWRGQDRAPRGRVAYSPGGPVDLARKRAVPGHGGAMGRTKGKGGAGLTCLTRRTRLRGVNSVGRAIPRMAPMRSSETTAPILRIMGSAWLDKMEPAPTEARQTQTTLR